MKYMARVAAFSGANAELVQFWQSLKPGFKFFEQTRRLPNMGVDALGQYRLNADPETVGRAVTIVAR
jgi:hypothetical protein